MQSPLRSQLQSGPTYNAVSAKLGGHVPVMLPEVLVASQPLAGAVVVDGTFGAGGYSQAFLDAQVETLLGLDQDPTAVAAAKARFQNEPRFQIAHANFQDLNSVLGDLSATNPKLANGNIDVLVLDLGVSSMQLDQAERGFSFQKDGPLDMRMNTAAGQTAADVVNTLDEKTLADIIWRFGEERMSRRIANAIVRRRAHKSFERTLDLADVVRGVMGGDKARYKKGKKLADPATRTFQALRIYVNDELGVIERVLKASIQALKSGGRLVVVTFHSLEDRIVKQFMRQVSGQTGGSTRHMPQVEQPAPLFTINKRKALIASAEEIDLNPRSRSAKLRVAIRTAEPAHNQFFDADQEQALC